MTAGLNLWRPHSDLVLFYFFLIWFFNSLFFLIQFKKKSILRLSFAFIYLGVFYEGLKDSSLSEILVGLLRNKQFP